MAYGDELGVTKGQQMNTERRQADRRRVTATLQIKMFLMFAFLAAASFSMGYWYAASHAAAMVTQ